MPDNFDKLICYKNAVQHNFSVVVSSNLVEMSYFSFL